MGKRQFVSVTTIADAWARCPWAAVMVRAWGGVWCFESMRDFSAWSDTTKDPQDMRKPGVGQVICAWCKKIIKKGSLPASHAQCAPCQQIMLAEATAFHSQSKK